MSKTARRALIIFTIALAVVLYFSSSIRYWMTPKVTLSTVNSGTIVWQRQISQMRWSSPQVTTVAASPYLPENIKITDGQEFQSRQVLQGEKLFTLDQVTLDSAIVEAEESYASQLSYEVSYRRELTEAQKNAQEVLTQATTALEKGATANAKRKAQLEQAYQTAQEDYDLIVTQGIYSGTTLEIVTAKTQKAQACLDALKALRQNGYAMVAPCDGLLVSWPSDVGTALQANQQYFTIIPDDAERQLVVTLGEECTLPNELAQVTLASTESALERYTFSMTSKGTNAQGAVELTLEGDRTVFEKIDLSKSYKLNYESEFYQALVPNEAFITQDTVYVVKSQYNNGQTEQVIQSVKVNRESGNASYTPVTGNSLSVGDQVVTGWDRTITVGQTVIVVNSLAQ